MVALPPAAKRVRRPAINRSPAILKIPKNPANPASDNGRPSTRRKKGPPTSHQPIACNPRNSQKSCKSCFRQWSPFPPPQKGSADQLSTDRLQSQKSPKILQILLQTMVALPPAAKRVRRPAINRSPKILQILLQTMVALPPAAKRVRRPAIKSCKSCFRQPPTQESGTAPQIWIT